MLRNETLSMRRELSQIQCEIVTQGTESFRSNAESERRDGELRDAPKI